MTVAPVLDAPEQQEMRFIRVRRQVVLQQRQAQTAERRRILADIRQRYRNTPAEEVDDSLVIGRGQVESAGPARPQGMRTRVR